MSRIQISIMIGTNPTLGCGIFLHLCHALLAIATVSGFHFTKELWDNLPRTLITKVNAGPGVNVNSLASGVKSCQGHDSGNNKDVSVCGDILVDSGLGLTTSLWLLFIGLLGLCALGVMITVWTPQVLKNMLKWYYAGAAFFMLFFATTSYDKVGTEFGKCTSSGYCPSFLFPIFLILVASICHTLIFGAGFLIALIDQAKPCSTGTSSRTCPYAWEPTELWDNCAKGFGEKM